MFWRTDFVGVAMILCGLVFVLVNFKVIPVNDFVLTRVLGILAIMAGLIFLFLTGAGGGLFWFVIPAGASLTGGFVTLILGTGLFVSLTSAILCAFGIGATFLWIFLSKRNHWWALVPAFTLFGLGLWAIVGIEVPLIGYHPVALIFAVGASFLVAYASSVQKVRMRWSLVTGCIIVGLSICYTVAIFLARWSGLWPMVLLAVGVATPIVVLVMDRFKPAR